MLISELTESLAGRNEQSIQVLMGQLEISEEADHLQIQGTDHELVLDEQAQRTLASFLDINKPYLAKCPPDLRRTNFNYWLRSKEATEGVLEISDDKLVAMHAPNVQVLPLTEVAGIVGRTFNPADEVVTLIRDDKKFHLDIRTHHHVEVRPDERIEGRQVGDITHGGVRLLASPSERIAPEVHTYLHRLWCTNGCTSPTAESRIRLRGHTVPEILVELEVAANQVLSGLDGKLQDYAATAERQIPGNPTAFAFALADEHDLGPRLTDRIIRQTTRLPEDASLYDVMNIFTAIASGGSVNYRSMTTLQGIGGEMAFSSERTLARCTTCERPFSR